MKKFIISSILFLSVLLIYSGISIFLGACSSDGDDSDGGSSPFSVLRPESLGIGIELQTKAQSINANPTNAGETFSKVYEFDMGKEFKDRYGLDPQNIDSFIVKEVEVKWVNGNLCSKLESYTIQINYPDFVALNAGTNVVTKSITRTKTEFGCSSDVILAFQENSFKTELDAAQAANKAPEFSTEDKRLQYDMLTTNFAKAIRDNKKITINFTMKAKEAIEAGAGILITLKSKAKYYKKLETSFVLPYPDSITVAPTISYQSPQKIDISADLINKALSAASININQIKSAEVDFFTIVNDNVKLPITGEVQLFEGKRDFSLVDFYTGDNVPRDATKYKNSVKFGFWRRPVKPNRTNFITNIKDGKTIEGTLKDLRNFDTKEIKVKLNIYVNCVLNN